MRKGIFSTLTAALGLILLTGCFSSPSEKQSTALSILEPTASPNKSENTESNPPKQTPVPSDNSSSIPKPDNTPSNPSDKDANTDKKGQQVDASKQGNAIQAEAGAEASSQPSNSPSKDTAEAGSAQVTVEQLKGKYSAQLKELENEVIGQLQNIYNQAAVVKQSEQSKSELYNAYLKKVVALEDESQAKVNQLLSQMKVELSEHQFPTDSVNELRSTYYAEVAKVKDSFTEKAKTEFGRLK